MSDIIRYKGLSTTPNDLDSKDGELEIAINTVNEHNGLSPIHQPKEVFAIQGDFVTIYIHETAKYEHCILRQELTNTETLSWIERNDTSSTPTLLMAFNSTIYDVASVGNTLVVLAANGKHYFLWKEDDGTYDYLGTRLPECPISFGLRGTVEEYGLGDTWNDEPTFEVALDEAFLTQLTQNDYDIWDSFNETTQNYFTEQVLGKVNKFIADNSTNGGKFLYPFLVRYAYRLYDGSLTMHSAPVLMIASSDIAPQVFMWGLYQDGHWVDHEDSKAMKDAVNLAMGGESGKLKPLYVKLTLGGVFHELDYAVTNGLMLSDLQRWSDIVRSVDVFVSAPFYTYDQNGKCTGFNHYDETGCYCVCKHMNRFAGGSSLPNYYQRHYYPDIMLMTHYTGNYNATDNGRYQARLELPRRGVGDVKRQIKDCSLFYMLESVNVGNLPEAGTRKVISIDANYLQSLTSREVMNDDYDSHDNLIARYPFTYNSRLHLADLDKQLFAGWHPLSMLNYTDGYYSRWGGTNHTQFHDGAPKNVRIWFFIRQDGKEVVVGGNTNRIGLYSPLLYFFYPNVNAYKAVVSFAGAAVTRFELPLEQHSGLNGAFFFDGFVNNHQPISQTPTASTLDALTFPMRNKIYTSEVGNPFYFPLTGINTVGNGKIVGMACAAKPLSEGQFGQFPLYVFTTDGIWSLETSGTGAYTTKQPLSRDICIGSDSITPIDSAVLFATDGGVMMLQGSSVKCISDALNEDSRFSFVNFPKRAELMGIYEDMGGRFADLEKDVVPFITYIRNCKMLYDYANKRIYVFNFSYDYGYVLSLETWLWTMITTRSIVEVVRAYPEALVVKQGEMEVGDDTEWYSVLCDFTQRKSVVEDVTSLIVTRPFKFGDATAFKTVETLIQQGLLLNENIRQVLYASNDYEHWFVVGSSSNRYYQAYSGTPYKAYRLATIVNLRKGDALTGFTSKTSQRLNNKQR